MHKWLVLIAIVAPGCATDTDSLGWTRVAGDVRYPPTDPDSVVVLDAKPEDAEVLGQVHGIHWKTSAIEDARRRAAAIGADAIVPRATGDEAPEYPFFPFTTDWVEATVLRLARPRTTPATE